MFALPAVHAVCNARSMAIHNRVSFEPYRASRSFPYLIHPGAALGAPAAGRRPAVLHRDLLGPAQVFEWKAGDFAGDTVIRPV